eukprot:jgi/Mesen1/1582/ME000134S00699
MTGVFSVLAGLEAEVVADELYDEGEDERVEAWLRKQPGHGGRQSDAILSCPACLTSLCFDCQRHERYKGQYRAMFVRNCKAAQGEVLRVDASRQQQPGRARGSRPKKADPAPRGMEADSTYTPVDCAVCGTRVAVLDSDEVYHFFNIIPSYS